MPDPDPVSVTVTRQDHYRFLVDFGPGLPPATADEAPPLGGGAGPSPTHLLAAAVANCLSASFVFAVAKFHEDPGAVSTTVTCDVGRNDQGRLRVLALDAVMTLGATPASMAHLDRALAEFEDFCTVSQSVKAGIPFEVRVNAPDGSRLK
jgi:uncharacterized OsmC-like protein